MTTDDAGIFPELDDLIKIMNTLPGVEVFECEFLKNERISIWFKALDRRGLFLISRACSIRYWSNSDNWIISVNTGDQFINNNLPIYFCLFSLKDRESCRKELPGLVSSIKKLMKDKSTLEAYNLGNLYR